MEPQNSMLFLQKNRHANSHVTSAEDTAQRSVAVRRRMKYSLLTITLALFLSACSQGGTTIEKENENPYTAARYGDELATFLADLIILDNPIAKDERMNKIIQNEIEAAKKISNSAHARLAEGMQGAMIGAGADVGGWSVLLDQKLYLSSDFFTEPGPNLHAYLTTAVDPRDVEFPDETAVDLGRIQSAYGAQTFDASKNFDEKFRTLVLYDKTLEYIYSFAQLSKRY